MRRLAVGHVADRRSRRSRRWRAQQKSPGAGPIIVLETVKGTIEFETYPEEAPKTVARIVELVKKNFYNGLRFHRAEPNFVIQVGDPVSRDVSRAGVVGPAGQRQADRRRGDHEEAPARPGRGGDGAPGRSDRPADSQFFILRRAAPELDGKYTVFGKVLKGMDVVAKIQTRRRAQTSLSEGRGGRILTSPFRSG